MEWIIGGLVVLLYIGCCSLLGRCMATPDDSEIEAELHALRRKESDDYLLKRFEEDNRIGRRQMPFVALTSE